FAPKARSRANAQRRDHGFTGCDSHRYAAVVHRECDLDLRYSAATRFGSEIVNQQTRRESADRRNNQNPDGAAWALDCDRTLDQVRGDQLDKEVIAHRNQPASDCDRNGEYEIFLIVREAQPLEYSSGADLYSLPPLDDRRLFHLHLSRIVAD